ncbi:MAG: tetratricopeptide repeat protein [Deltaproteobacteria bacterium]|jgi:hypothetical protein|nr:tetratricopeptide repeat protein [Deltaproteobacteria bacterium]
MDGRETDCEDNLAEALHGIGEHGLAANLLERVAEARRASLGSEHLTTLDTEFRLARSLLAQGQPYLTLLALRLLKGVSDGLERLLGSGDPRTLAADELLMTSLSGLTAIVEGHFLETYRKDYEGLLAARGAWDGETLAASERLGAALMGTGEAGDLAEAVALLAQAAEGSERVNGPDSPSTIGALGRLAGALDRREDLEGARAVTGKLIAALERTRGPASIDTLKALNEQAHIVSRLGDGPAARDAWKLLADRLSVAQGPADEGAVLARHNCVAVAVAIEDWGTALAASWESVKALETERGPDHPLTLTALLDAAKVLELNGQLRPAADIMERVAEGRMRILGPGDPATVGAREFLAQIRNLMG